MAPRAAPAPILAANGYRVITPYLRGYGSTRFLSASTPRNGQPAEFDQWRWERLDRVADLVVPFRREVYRTVARSFAEFARSE